MRFSASRLSLAAMAVAALAVAGVTAGCGGSSVSKTNAAHTEAPSGGGQSSAASVPPANVKLLIKSDEEHAKKGPEGAWHDAYLPAGFTVQPSQQVTVTIYNYDEGAHSFNAPSLGVNKVIPAASKGKPAKATFSFKAPSTAGQYEWWCALPCDTWAMTHKGYMRGVVTVA